MKFSSLTALEVVLLTISSAASNENFVKIITFLFQWWCLCSYFEDATHDISCGLNPSSWGKSIGLSHMVNIIMATGILVTQRARASAALVSTQFSWNIPVSAPKGLKKYWNTNANFVSWKEAHLNHQKYSRRTRSVPGLLMPCFVQNFKIIWLLSKKLRVVEILQDFDFKMSFQDFLNYIGPLGTIGANWKLRDGIKTQLEFLYWNNLLVTVQAIKSDYCFVLVYFVLVMVTDFSGFM